MADIHQKESFVRRVFINLEIDPTMKSLLEDTKPTTLLYGDKLADKLEEAKNIKKAVQQLKKAEKIYKIFFKTSEFFKEFKLPVPARTSTTTSAFQGELQKQQGSIKEIGKSARLRECNPQQKPSQEPPTASPKWTSKELVLDVKIAGRLKNFEKIKRYVTNDTFVLDCVMD